MKLIIILSSAFVLFSCSENVVCKCTKAGEDLNAYANRFLTEVPSQTNRDSIALLKKERETVCKEVKTLSTDELEKLSAECETLSLETER